MPCQDSEDWIILHTVLTSYAALTEATTALEMGFNSATASPKDKSVPANLPSLARLAKVALTLPFVRSALANSTALPSSPISSL